MTPRPLEPSGLRLGRFLFIIILPFIVWSLNGIFGAVVLLREIRKVPVKAVNEAPDSVIRTDFSPAIAANGNRSQVSPGLAVIREGQAIGGAINGLIDSSQDTGLFYRVSFRIRMTPVWLAGTYGSDLQRAARYGIASPRTTQIYNTMRSVQRDGKIFHEGYILFDRRLDRAVERALSGFKQLTGKLGDLVHIEDEQKPWYD